jgi:hypothetical protein
MLADITAMIAALLPMLGMAMGLVLGIELIQAILDLLRLDT